MSLGSRQRSKGGLPAPRSRWIIALSAATSVLMGTAAVALVVVEADEPEAPHPTAVVGIPGAASRRTSQITPPGLRSARPRFVRRQLVVRFDPDATPRERARARALVGARRVRVLPLLRAEVLRLPSHASVPQARREISSSQAVFYSEPNFIYETAAVRPNDPMFDQLWGEDNSGQVVGTTTGVVDADVDAPEAWDVTTGSQEVVVAVVDTGVAYEHPDLAANIWTNPGESGAGRESNGRDDDGNGLVDDVRGWDWVGNDNQPLDLNGHGTHVAGTIGARGNDGFGVSGVTWQARIMPLRALDASGSGTSADIASAFTYAGRHADVVNASLGSASFSQAVLDAIALAPNTLFVVAAGNAAANNDTTPTYPCNYAVVNVVCVAATTSSDSLASFSNYGATTVDLAAPGSRILSSIPSFATPLSETFETDLAGRWTTGGTNNAWARASDQAGSYIADSPAGPYAPGTDAWIRTAASVAVSSASRCALSFALRIDVDQTDRFRVEASADGSSWTTLASWWGTTTGKFVSLTEELSVLESATSVHLGFRLVSDGDATARDGVAVDDVVVRCVQSAGTTGHFAYLSGTSMATPHVAGAAALVLSAVPAATPVDVAAALARSGDTLPALTGATVTGKRLNVAAALSSLLPAVATPPAPTATAAPTAASTPLNESRTPTPATSPDERDTPAPQETPPPAAGGDTPTPTPARTDANQEQPPSEPPPQEEPGGGDQPGEPSEPPSQEEPGGEPDPSEPPPAEPGEDEGRPPEPQTHARRIVLRLSRHLVAVGRIEVPDGHTACLRQRSLKIVRNGRLIAETGVGADGAFKVRLPDLAGRWAAKIQERSAGEGSADRCDSARSEVIFHAH